MADTLAQAGRRQADPDSTPLLAVQGLNVAYGEVQVLWDVSLDVYEGEIVALVGANGAGKSTLLSTVSGLLRPQSGSIHFAGRALAGQPTKAAVGAGLVHVPEGRRLFGGLTVAENLRMGAFLRTDRPAVEADYARMLDLFPRLKERLTTLAGKLSGGEQQMVAIARGLMARPRLLMLDELSLGLAPLVVDSLIDALRTVNASGTTLLVVEQDVQTALDLAHYGYVLETGTLALQGEAAALLADPRIRTAFLGLAEE
jgi:branched-chain amino acid transport system ATP-binding protein